MRLNPQQVVKWVKANFEVKERRSGKQLQLRICNPFQEREEGIADTKFHMAISPYEQLVHDWRPNYQSHDGSFLRFVQEYLKCSKLEAIKAISNLEVSASSIFNEDEEEEEKPLVDNVRMELPSPCWDFENGPQKMRDHVTKYLKKRCVSLEKAKEWGVMYGIGSVIFPYIEYGEIVYWQSREVGSKEFLFPSIADTGVDKTNFLWGWHQAEVGEDLVIAEAIFCALSIGPGGLSCGGATLDEKQVKRIDALSPRRIILAKDNDDAGRAAVVSDYNLMPEQHDKLWYCFPPNIKNDKEEYIKDWNELNQLCVFKPNIASEQLGEDVSKYDNYVRRYIDTKAKKLTLSDVIQIRKSIRKKDKEHAELKKILNE